MDRLLIILGFCTLLACAPMAAGRAQPAFFSLFFEQLMPGTGADAAEATPGEAVFL